MPVVKESVDQNLFRFITDTNLLRQYNFLQTAVAVALATPDFILSHDLVREFNHYAAHYLCENHGKYRRRGMGITNSQHSPPPSDQVEPLMEECLVYIAKNWKSATAIHLAAYALWRLNWIHPFEEGNGRTARAVCYLILCVKLGFWLPGANTIPQQIRDNRGPYYAALRHADERFLKDQGIDVKQLEAYLDGLLATQLASA
jgi:Fic family protein